MIEAHITEYRNCEPNYERLCSEVKRILDVSFTERKIRTHSVEARAKSIESFRGKIEKTNEDDTPKYTQPLKEITDLAGVRVIAHTIDDIKKITDFVDQNFDVFEKRDVGEERAEKGQFGYQSIHFLVHLTEDRLALPENTVFRELVCEIQVRTVLQHAWAEMEHDIQYKGSANIPKSVKRKFLSLAGLLEIADREFASIQREDKKLKQDVLSDLQRDLTLDEIEKSGSNASEKSVNSTPQPEAEETSQVRSLLAAGKFKEAKDVYNKKIEIEPSSYTLYLGRARASFLLGETEQALQDIDKAEELQPHNSVINMLRSKVTDGSLALPLAENTTASDEKVKLGDSALSEGRPDAAYRLYLEAQSMGASWPFTTFKLALAGATAGDLTGAELHLNELKNHPGTPMEINIAALRAILSVLNKSDDFPERIDALKSLRAAKEDFNFEYSPLVLLQDLNTQIFWNETAEDVERILDILR